MKLYDAWLMQMESDFDAISSVLARDRPTSYCQAISKCQQVVEKAIKAVDIAVQSTVRGEGLPLDHDMSHVVRSSLMRLKYLPGTLDRDITTAVRLMVGRYESPVNSLCSLAPNIPPAGEPLHINSEYPYNTDGQNWKVATEWTVPATSFTIADVNRHFNTAIGVRQSAQRIVSTARLLSRIP